jgi:hypothetical protein
VRTKFKKTYYSVSALQDGTIVFASQTRKPVKSNVRGTPEIDEDGIHNWYIDKQEAVQGFTDWGKGVHHSAVVQCLNTKRIIREQVEGRLAKIEAQLVAIAEQLARIEKAKET